MCGTSGVKVTDNVAVNVCVGIKVGGSGVLVEVDVSKAVGSVANTAFCVNPAITVCAAEVLMEGMSGVVMPGNAQAIAVNNEIKIDNEIRLDIDMHNPFFGFLVHPLRFIS